MWRMTSCGCKHCASVACYGACWPPRLALQQSAAWTRSPRREVRAAVRAVVEKQMQAHGGVFVFRDRRTGENLPLAFEDIRLVRSIHGYGFFPNVLFHAKDMPEKQYALDFWLKPKGEGLELVDMRIQKGPKKEGNTWTYGDPDASCLVVDPGFRTSRRDRGETRLGGDVCDS